MKMNHLDWFALLVCASLSFSFLLFSFLFLFFFSILIWALFNFSFQGAKNLKYVSCYSRLLLSSISGSSVVFACFLFHTFFFFGNIPSTQKVFKFCSLLLPLGMSIFFFFWNNELELIKSQKRNLLLFLSFFFLTSVFLFVWFYGIYLAEYKIHHRSFFHDFELNFWETNEFREMRVQFSRHS